MHPILEKLGKEAVIFDGGMGTLLQEKGLSGGELPELWNLTRPEVIEEIQSAYAAAGADVLTTNTFGVNALKLAGTGHSVREVVSAAVRIARRAAGGRCAVALDMGPTGKLMRPFGELSFEDAYNLYKEVVLAGAEGADLVLIETMGDTLELKAAVLAAKENCALPVIATCTFDETGKLLTGGSIDAAMTLLESLGVYALGMNCGLGPAQMLRLLPELLRCTGLPVIVNANAGLPVQENGRTVYPVGPKAFCALSEEVFALGVSGVGGCCGTTPEHIALLSKSLSGRAVQKREVPVRTVVSSGTHTVVFGEKPVLIGERINPTGKPRLKEALRQNDLEFLCREGVRQADAGADVLDVNVGLPEIDEPAMMEQAIERLQGVVRLPLQIDTSDPAAMERALRVYNGKPLVNSVNGKRESLDAVLPLVKKYGAAVVALTLDENGIPETAEGRFRIAEKIVREAERYGIARKDILVDTLTMTVSTGEENAKVTLEALERVRRELGVHTVLGVSNVSFGLPRRELVTANFFTMAMQRGLSAGIVNVLSEALMDAYRSFCALSGFDPGCKDYIAAYAERAAPAKKDAAKDMTLFEAIVRGLREEAGALTDAALETAAPLDIVNGALIPALDEVGKGYEKGTVFLPQLLMSADAAKEAFERIKRKLAAGGEKAEPKGKIVLATVKGDIHDIGKNIVKVLLENYGFEVIDLGKDVAPETVLRAVRENGVKLAGLSALMTTTVPAMAETIELLHRETDCTVAVGGAVLNEEYAEMIGADFYSKDAMGTVRFAEKFFA